MTNRSTRRRPAGLLALALVALTAAGARGNEGRRVGTWAASPQRTEPANMPPAPGLADATLRQVVRVSLGGKRLRVRFSNAFGAKPLTILSAHVATPAGGAAIRAASRKPLAFGGRSSVTIPRGAPVVSDPVDFDLAPLCDLAVTVRVKDPTDAVTGHPGALGAYEQIIRRAHARGIKTYGATILPCEGSFYFDSDLEAARQEVNAWIRASGRFDAVIDFDAATRDPQIPSRLSAAADGGDHLHPGPDGYKIMAGAVDLELFGK